jgi:hypothetical protein
MINQHKTRRRFAPATRAFRVENNRFAATVMSDNIFEQLIEEEIEGVTADACGEAAIGSVSAGRRNGDHAWLDEE